MHKLYEQGEAQRIVSLFGGAPAQNQVTEFWREALRDKWAQDHPVGLPDLVDDL